MKKTLRSLFFWSGFCFGCFLLNFYLYFYGPHKWYSLASGIVSGLGSLFGFAVVWWGRREDRKWEEEKRKWNALTQKFSDWK